MLIVVLGNREIGILGWLHSGCVRESSKPSVHVDLYENAPPEQTGKTLHLQVNPYSGAESNKSDPREQRRLSLQDRNRKLESLMAHFDDDDASDSTTEKEITTTRRKSPQNEHRKMSLKMSLQDRDRRLKSMMAHFTIDKIDDEASYSNTGKKPLNPDASASCPALDSIEERLRRKLASAEPTNLQVTQTNKSLNPDGSASSSALNLYEYRLKLKMASGKPAAACDSSAYEERVRRKMAASLDE